MPNLQQQQQDRRARLHAIREEQNWLHTMQRTYLGLAMTRHAREIHFERRNRNHRRETHENQTPRLNVTRTPRSLVLTITEPHLQKVLAWILVLVFGCVLGVWIQMACNYFMISGKRVIATLLLFVGRVYLLWVFNLWRMWYVGIGDMEFRITMTAHMGVLGVILWILATLASAKLF